MVSHIAVCGDSFGVGEGIPYEECFEKSFGGVVSSHFNIPQRVYARSGCCNFTIYLQVKKIVEQTKHDLSYKPFVLITSTFHERLIFPIGDDGTEYHRPDLSEVEYTSYMPYRLLRPLEFEDKKPRLLSETVSNIWHFRKMNLEGLSRLFSKISKEKMDLLIQYYDQLFDTGIKQEYDNALYVTIHNLLKTNNIPHLILGQFDTNNGLTPFPNFMHFTWGEYTKRYPDPYNSGHCDEIGNKVVGELIIDHIEKNNLL